MEESINNATRNFPDPGSLDIGKMNLRFAELMNKGSIIPDPKTPEELYANARLSEFSGSFQKAREYYHACLQAGCECLDPHLRYLQLLEPQQGKDDAGKQYLKETAHSKTRVAELVAILLRKTEEKYPLLEEFVSKNPECGPAMYFLGLQFAAAEKSPRSLKDKKRERADLEKFQKLDAEGKVASWFMEPAYIDGWREEVKQRLRIAEGVAGAFQNPVNLRWAGHHNGWTGTISVSEIALELLWKRSTDSELKSTGLLTSRTYSTGHPHPKPSFEIPRFDNATQFEIRYRDVNGELIGPFYFELDPASESVASSKQELNVTRNGWASFRTTDQQVFLHFTHLMRHKPALNTIKYGLNSAHPDRELSLPSTRTGISHLDQKMPVFVEVPPDTKTVTIQVEFKDGDLARSTINRPVSR